MSQEKQVLDHLKSGNAITPRQAIENYNIYRLSARIFNLKKQYNAQLTISKDISKLYENEVVLHALALKRLEVSEKQIKGLKFGGKIKTGAMLIFAGVMGYTLIK